MSPDAFAPLCRAALVLLLAAALALAARPTPAAHAATNVPCDVNALISAIQAANSAPGADTLVLAAGCTYTLAAPRASDGGAHGPTGLPEITSAITIQGAGTTIARSSASGTPNFRIFHIASSGALTLDGVTISGGRAVGGNGANGGASGGGGGGGAPGLGGAIFNDGGALTVLNSTFSDNRALGGNGGAGRGDRINPRTYGGAGGLYGGDGGDSLDGVNGGGGGGGAGMGGAIFSTGPAARLTVVASTLFNNRALGGNGGASPNAGSNGNRGRGFGGALFIAGGEATITNSTFSDNQAADAAQGGNDPNGYRGGGGAIYIYDIENGKIVLITSATISGNAAPGGGGVYQRCVCPVGIGNTIIAGNSATATPSYPELVGSFSSLGGNLFGPTAGATISPGPGDRLNVADPRLAPLADNGGPTRTRAFLAGSPAVNAGRVPDCPATDQRGQPRRKANGFCDIGAYEAQPATISAQSGAMQTALINQPFPAALEARAADVAGNPLGGVRVQFAAPGSGASAVLSAANATTGANGLASVTARANGTIGGPYSVSASAGSATPAAFLLTNRGATATAITGHAPNPSEKGQAVTVTFQVMGGQPGGASPTGSVTVSGGGQSCSATLAASSCTLTFDTAGYKLLTASYAGDTLFEASVSSQAAHKVLASGVAPSSIALDAAPNPSGLGQAVTFTARVAGAAGDTTPASGSVAFFDGETVIGTADVASGGVARFTTAALAGGSHRITAEYSGDNHYAASVSAPVTQVVLGRTFLPFAQR